ncbi:MAG TPA: TMEM175 family protein [Mucilaginibacter sp.]|jgi:uncharacterized membrane protein
MNVSDENEIKKEFQLERLIFFSDAVFAIIITIMILDVKLPEQLIHPSEEESKQAFINILPKVVAYCVSFSIIGSFWVRHLKIFSFLKDYNPQLLVLNLLFLFSVSLFPFALSFAFSSSNVMQYTWGFYIYMGIIYLALLTQTLLMHYLIRNKEVLCLKAHDIEKEFKWKVRRMSYAMIPFFLIVITIVGNTRLTLYIVFGGMVIYGILVSRLKKKWYPNVKDDSVTLFSFFKKAKIEQHSQKRVN